MPSVDQAGDDDRTWRCKECGARQPTPEPPCERCWNTTFVAGDGADDALGGGESLAFTPAQAAQVRTATTRSAALSGVLAVCFGGVQAALSLGGALDGLAFLGLVAAAGSTVVFVVAALVATAAYRWRDRLLP